jgi:hypothetical protein
MRSASCRASLRERGSKARGLDRVSDDDGPEFVLDDVTSDACALSNILVLQSCDGRVGFVWEFFWDATIRSKTVGSAFGSDGSVGVEC